MNRFLILALFFIFSCSKNPDVLTYNPEIESKKLYDVSPLITDNKVDILWVIDNSGSMDRIQRNIAANLALFMDEFTVKTKLRWKMGIVSTDDSEAPYLGFSTPFDYNNAAPVATAKAAVDSLGTWGSGSEYSLYNAKRAIDENSDFLRPNAHFVVIFVSDEYEQSNKYPHYYKWDQFLNDMKAKVENRKIFRAYGVLDLKGIANCTGYSSSTDIYKDSQFEHIINKTNGFVVPGCGNFGSELTKIGEDIVQIIEKPKVLLREKPVIDTIRVFYKGHELFPGKESNGGSWYYDDRFNTVNFYSMDFANNEEIQLVEIDFEVDDYDN